MGVKFSSINWFCEIELDDNLDSKIVLKFIITVIRFMRFVAE